MLDRGLREAKEGKERNERLLLLLNILPLATPYIPQNCICATLIVWTNMLLDFQKRQYQVKKRHLLNKESVMTRVCVGCGTEVTDKEGRPVEKLYDQVSPYQMNISLDFPTSLRPCWRIPTY